MGDRVAVLDKGVLQQCATPRDLYAKPDNLFVAGFIGSPAMNLFTVPVGLSGIELGGISIPPPSSANLDADEVVVGIRPEDLAIVDGRSVPQSLPVDVDVVEELGSDAFLYGSTELFGAQASLVARADWRYPPHKGDRLNLAVDVSRVHLFSTITGKRL